MYAFVSLWVILPLLMVAVRFRTRTIRRDNMKRIHGADGDIFEDDHEDYDAAISPLSRAHRRSSTVIHDEKKMLEGRRRGILDSIGAGETPPRLDKNRKHSRSRTTLSPDEVKTTSRPQQPRFCPVCKRPCVALVESQSGKHKLKNYADKKKITPNLHEIASVAQVMTTY